MKLLIDAGNTRMKMALLVDGALHLLAPVEYTDRGVGGIIAQQAGELEHPGEVYVANVAGAEMARGIAEFCARHWRLEASFIRVQREWDGFITDYRDIEQLGVDRWLAALAAWRRYRNALCVVDCGTAVTIDLVGADGRHRGGFILPGAALMQQSLNAGTRNIRAVPGGEPGLEPGTTTTECIVNGSARAIASAIESTMQDQRRILGGDLRLVITGGNAESIMQLLDIESGLIPALVLEGLAALAS